MPSQMPTYKVVDGYLHIRKKKPDGTYYWVPTVLTPILLELMNELEPTNQSPQKKKKSSKKRKSSKK